MGSEAAPHGSPAARSAEPSRNQQYAQQEQQPVDRQEQQLLEPAQQQSLDYLLNIINQVVKDDPTGVFEYPVDGDLVPGYYDKIKQPMCFHNMRTKLQAREYRTWRDFSKDMDLIFENAKTFNPGQHRIHKLAINLQRNARKLLQQVELPARRCIHLLHPAGPKAAAAEEQAQILCTKDDARSSQLLLRPTVSLDAEDAAAGLTSPAGDGTAHSVLHPHAVRYEGGGSTLLPASAAAVVLPVPEDLAAAGQLWDAANEQLGPGDWGLLFRELPEPQLDNLMQQLKQPVLYQPYSTAAGNGSSGNAAVGRSRQQQQQQLPGAASNAQQPDPQPQQQQQQSSADWRHVRQPVSWRCKWLYTRIQELSSLISLLQSPGSTVPLNVLPPAAAAAAAGADAAAAAAAAAAAVAAAGAAGGDAATAAAAAAATAAAFASTANANNPSSSIDGGGGGDSVQMLQVQQRGVLLQQHVESVGHKRSSILSSPFYAAHIAGTHADALRPKQQPAAAEQEQQQQAVQQQQQQQQQGVDSMDVDQPAAAAAGAVQPSMTAAATPPVAAAAVFGGHEADPALIFSSLELVEQQLVAARLLLSRAYGIEVSLAPAGVRLGQYTAARLLGDASGAGTAAGLGRGAGGTAGSKRAAGVGGLSRAGSGMLGGSGARGLQREGSMAGSMKKRRVERSGIAGIGGVVEDDGVLSPSASLPARLMERAVTSIHIPLVRELPSQEWAARQAAASSWRAAVKAQGEQQGLAKPPPEVCRVLEALAAEEGSSSEDTSDEAYGRMHQPLEEDEHIRLNGPTGGGRNRNKHKTKQTGGSSKQQQQQQQQQQPESPFSKQPREQPPDPAAAAAAERDSSPAAAAVPANSAAGLPAAATAPARAASIATAAGPGLGGSGQLPSALTSQDDDDDAAAATAASKSAAAAAGAVQGQGNQPMSPRKSNSAEPAVPGAAAVPVPAASVAAGKGGMGDTAAEQQQQQQQLRSQSVVTTVADLATQQQHQHQQHADAAADVAAKQQHLAGKPAAAPAASSSSGGAAAAAGGGARGGGASSTAPPRSSSSSRELAQRLTPQLLASTRSNGVVSCSGKATAAAAAGKDALAAASKQAHAAAVGDGADANKRAAGAAGRDAATVGSSRPRSSSRQRGSSVAAAAAAAAAVTNDPPAAAAAAVGKATEQGSGSALRDNSKSTSPGGRGSPAAAAAAAGPTSPGSAGGAAAVAAGTRRAHAAAAAAAAASGGSKGRTSSRVRAHSVGKDKEKERSRPERPRR